MTRRGQEDLRTAKVWIVQLSTGLLQWGRSFAAAGGWSRLADAGANLADVLVAAGYETAEVGPAFRQVP